VVVSGRMAHPAAARLAERGAAAALALPAGGLGAGLLRHQTNTPYAAGMTLDDFLAALDEREPAAVAVTYGGTGAGGGGGGGSRFSATTGGTGGGGGGASRSHGWRPREAAAIRAIISEYQGDDHGGPEYYQGLWFALCRLAPERLEP